MDISSAIVLAAGEGQRLRPLTKHRPKPMLPAGNRPILAHVLDALIEASVTNLHLVVGYERERVQSYFGPTRGDATITYHIQDKQLGSGHALLQARGAVDSDFLVVNGDEIMTSKTVEQVIDAHSATETVSLSVIESDRAPEYGAVRMEGDRIIEFAERPDNQTYRLLNRGVYAFGPSIFAEIESTHRTNGELAITDTISRLIDRDTSVKGIRTGGIWSAATYPWDLPGVASDVLSQGLVNESEVAEDSYVADSAQIHEDATLHAPVVVGPDTVIGPRAVVGSDTAIGQNVTVGAGSVITHSVVDADSRIGPNATLVETVTGQAVDVGAGTTAPGGPSDVRIQNTIHENADLGCVIADRAEVGGGAMISPGALLGPEAKIQHGTHVSGNVNEGAEVRR